MVCGTFRRDAKIGEFGKFVDSNLHVKSEMGDGRSSTIDCRQQFDCFHSFFYIMRS